MGKSSSTQDELVSPHDVQASETHCEDQSVSALGSLSASSVRRKKSERMMTGSSSSRGQKISDKEQSCFSDRNSLHNSKGVWQVTVRFVCPVTAVVVLLLAITQLARAGGPRYIAGVSYFNQGTAGTPLTWAQGAVNYYTDQGSLSATVSGPQGAALV